MKIENNAYTHPTTISVQAVSNYARKEIEPTDNISSTKAYKRDITKEFFINNSSEMKVQPVKYSVFDKISQEQKTYGSDGIINYLGINKGLNINLKDIVDTELEEIQEKNNSKYIDIKV